MGVICFSECGACQRHVRCGERACPFCGAVVASALRVLEYRLLTRLDRSRVFSLGAALAAAGFVTACEGEGGPVYGAPCNPPSCVVPQGGGGGGSAGPGAGAGGMSEGGHGGKGGAMSDGGSSVGLGGTTSAGGGSGEGGTTSEDGGRGEGGTTSEGGSGEGGTTSAGGGGEGGD